MCVAPAHRLRASNAVARCRPRPPRAGPELALHNAVSSRLAQSDCLSRRPRMLRAVRRSLLAAMAATVAVALACNRDAESPPPASPNAWLTDIGGLVVSTATTGSSIDPNGYVVVVDNTQRQSIAPSGVVVFTGLAPGQHTVALTDVASNCTVSTPLTVMVSLLGSGTAAFPVSCAPAGDLTVSASTTGSNLDPDGYTVTLDGNASTSQPLATNGGTATFKAVAAGSHSVALSGVATNCTVSGPNPQSVTVPTDGTASASFTVTCVAQTGTLTVTASTTGSNLDPDGYTVTLDGNASTSQPLATNGGTATFKAVAAGSHSVALSGVATNCTVSGPNPQSVTVPTDGTASASFTVTCVAQTGTLTVTASTTGSNLDPDGYTVTLDGNASTSQPLATNGGTATFNAVAAGSHSVALSGVATNCTVSGPNPQSVTVPAGGTASASFTVTCVALPTPRSSELSTTGSNLDPDGYTVTLDGNASTSQPLATNGGTATFNAVAAGSHSVALSGVATNCTVSGPNPQSVTVPAGGTASASFTVNCTALVSRITGVGQIFTGPASPGSDAKTFDFDVQAGPSGRVKYTDWHEVFPNGMPLTLIVDPSDAGTAITAFRTSSSTCHTATGGAEFDAIGRINDATGTLVTFTMIACDSTTDANYLRVEIPSFGYSRAGVLTSGEIDRTGP